jgi:hypothetical protein
MDKIHIIDALGPFIEPSDQSVINWSKVDFSNLERSGSLDAAVAQRIEQRFESYVIKVRDLGYDSMSFDDLAHITIFPWYGSELTQLLGSYHSLYKHLFKITKRHGMKIFINTDYLFQNDAMREHRRQEKLSNEDFFVEVLDTAFKDFPEIDGIILRIGENDGKDVESNFLSKLILRTPKKANKLLKRILPLFEQYNKKLIFRTWTVGVYQVGDLIWNQQTFATVFDLIDSDALIISMKFGDTDFMRYLELNPLFLTTKHKKIVELQTRREWEGMGTLPSFIGWDYDNYFQDITKNETVVGIHVWCQTGGWAKSTWNNITFLKDSSFWNELNTYVTVKMYRDKCTPERAIELFCLAYNIPEVHKFTELLKLSEIAIKQGLYIRELAEQKHYFRRSRVPTLLWLTWDKVLLQPVAIFLIRTFVKHPSLAIQESKIAVDATAKMIRIAKDIKLKQSVIDSIEFQHATLTLFVDIKAHILGLANKSTLSSLQTHIDAYTVAYPQHFTIPNVKLLKTPSRSTRFSKYPLGLLLRHTSMYRKRDKILMTTSRIQRQLVRYYLHRSKSHLSDQSMGIDVIFK